MLALVLYAAASDYTQRKENPVREGPGNYYPLLYHLPSGVAVQVDEKQGGWNRIRVLEDSIRVRLEAGGEAASESWMPQNCLDVKKPSMDYGKLDIEWNSISASRAGVAAAVRGYAMEYGGADEKDIDSLALLTAPLFDIDEYRVFKRETLQRAPMRSGGHDLKNRFSDYFKAHDLDVLEQGIGLGLATRLAQTGLVQNMAMLAYINMITTLLAESTGAYDVPFRTLVLRDTLAASWSLPGGYLFISQGMLDLCSDEAELAAVIAREMMHLIEQHAFSKTPVGQTQKQVQDAMDELDAQALALQTDAPVDPIKFAVEAFEFTVNAKNPLTEQNADRGAAVLLARAGYEPQAVLQLVIKLLGSGIETRSFMRFDPRHQRLQALRVFLQQEFTGWQGNTFARRFSDRIHR